MNIEHLKLLNDINNRRVPSDCEIILSKDKITLKPVRVSKREMEIVFYIVIGLPTILLLFYFNIQSILITLLWIGTYIYFMYIHLKGVNDIEIDTVQQKIDIVPSSKTASKYFNFKQQSLHFIDIQAIETSIRTYGRTLPHGKRISLIKNTKEQIILIDFMNASNGADFAQALAKIINKPITIA